MQAFIKHSPHESKASFLTRRAIFYFIIIFGAASTVAVFFIAKQSQESLLYERAASIAALINPKEVEGLSGTSADLESPVYKELKTNLIEYREANTEVRFAYIYGVRGGKAFFYVDSEDSVSPDYSPPGQVYEESSLTFKQVLTTGLPITEGPLTDRWGTWVSGLAPVTDPETRAVVAAVGVDIDARWHYAAILAQAAIPALLTFIALLVVLGSEYLRRKESRTMF
jgi:hypothetical protein